MSFRRCWIPRPHPVHDWLHNGEQVTCAGHGLRGTDAPRPADVAPSRGEGATLASLLCHPDVTVIPAVDEVAVAVLLPSHLATRLAALLPDPDRRDSLTAAAHTIAREEEIAELDRRDLLRSDPR